MSLAGNLIASWGKAGKVEDEALNDTALQLLCGLLTDVQHELEREKAAAEGGAEVWVRKAKALEGDLAAQRARADREDRTHQALAAEQQRLSARLQSVQNKTTETAAARIAALGRELDMTERLFHMQCERQYLTALSATDAAGRTTLHHAAACNGVMVGFLLSYRASRFRDATTFEGAHPVLPLFPADGWVSPVTGQLWQPGSAPRGEGDDALVAPAGYVSVNELLKANANTKAESMPPDSPKMAPGKPFLPK
jgi:hypothetical protein